MRREAEASVAARRGPELAALRPEPSRPGVFAWAGGPPTAGESAVLAYNKASGPLRRATCSNLLFYNRAFGLLKRNHCSDNPCLHAARDSVCLDKKMIDASKARSPASC